MCSGDTPHRHSGIPTSSSYAARVTRSLPRAATHALYDDALRRGILDEATRRLVDAGPEKLGLRPLAASQGTSTTAIYTMFGGKTGLLAAVAQDADRQLAESLREVLGHDSVESDMRALCRAYRRWALDHQGLYGLIVGEVTTSGRAEVRQRGEQWREPLLEVVDALVDEGVFRATDVHDTATTIWASLHGIVSLEISVWRDSPSAEQYFETQLAAILRSWTASAPAAAYPAAGAVGDA